MCFLKSSEVTKTRKTESVPEEGGVGLLSGWTTSESRRGMSDRFFQSELAVDEVR